MAGEGGLDLRRFDAETAHPDLAVGAAGDVDAAIGPVAAEVAGAVEHGVPARGIGQEACAGQLVVTQVAARQPWGADDDLAQLPDSGPAAAAIPHPQLHPVD